MLPLKACDLAEIFEGEIISGEESQVLASISIDTRTLQPGALFIPLKGERFDGRAFIAEAIRLGAGGVLTDELGQKQFTVTPAQNTVTIKVKDTLRSLQNIAGFVRNRLQGQVVGITGSTGKTSTKDMMASILSVRFRTVCSERSHNNEIGVPLTLLKAEEDTEVVIVELAMRGVGQIKELAEIARPTLGVVTNVGKSHFEFLESEQLIARAKGELIEAVSEGGAVVLNADDIWTENLRKLARCRVVTYGVNNSSDVRAEEVAVDRGKPSFVVASEHGTVSVRLPVLGRHNVYNALAAAAVALQLGLSSEDVKKGLERCKLPKMRMESFTTAEGITMLNDAYNANPASMEAALLTLRDAAGDSRKIAVLGDMLELGSISELSHYQVGEMVQDLGIDILIAVGEMSKRTAEGALAKGMAPSDVFLCKKPSEAIDILGSILKPGDVVLVKASRAMEMEEVVNSMVRCVASNE